MRRISGTDGPDFQICSKSTINKMLAHLLRVVELSESPRITAPSLMSKDKTRHFPLHPPNQPGNIAKQNPTPTHHNHSFHVDWQVIADVKPPHNLPVVSCYFFGFPQITLGPSPLVAFFINCLTNFLISVPHGCILTFYFLQIYTFLFLFFPSFPLD